MVVVGDPPPLPPPLFPPPPELEPSVPSVSHLAPKPARTHCRRPRDWEKSKRTRKIVYVPETVTLALPDPEKASTAKTW